MARVIRSHNRFCGPFAVGYCADVSPDVVERIVKHQTGQQRVEDMHPSEISASLNSLGCAHRFETPYIPRITVDQPTLAAWYRQRSNPTGLYIVVVAGHVLVVDGGIILDNNNPAGRPFALYGRKRRRVMLAWEVTRD